MSRLPVLGLIALSLSLTSCASLLNGEPSSLRLSVDPPAATTTVVRDDGQTAGTIIGDSQAILLDRGHDYVLHTNAAGYQTQETHVGRQVAPAFWGNLGIAAIMGAVFVVPGVGALDPSGLSRGLSILLGVPLTAVVTGGAMILDGANGRMWDHDTHDVRVKLAPQP